MRKNEIARNRYHNMFEEKKTKRAYRKSKIRSMPQRKGLQQQIENLTVTSIQKSYLLKSTLSSLSLNLFFQSMI